MICTNQGHARRLPTRPASIQKRYPAEENILRKIPRCEFGADSLSEAPGFQDNGIRDGPRREVPLASLNLALQSARMMTLSAFSLAALPNVSYALIMSSSLNSWVMSLRGSSWPETTLFRSIGVVTVSTSRVVMVTL